MRFTSSWPARLGLGALLALPGCASGAATTAAGPGPSGASATDGAAAASRSSARVQALATPTPSGTTPVAGPTLFAAPSGNITCLLARTSVRCDIRRHDWTPPPKPATCPLDWGPALALTTKAGFLCVGDALGPTDRQLPYGAALRNHQMVCASARTGVRCENRGSHHGFVLARAAYRLF